MSNTSTATQGPPSGAADEALIQAEQADAVYGNIKGLMFGNAFVACACAWAFLQGPHTVAVYAWLAAQLSMNALGYWSERRPRRPATPRNAARRLRAVTMGVSFGGWMWAAGMVALWPQSQLGAQWLLCLSGLGLITGAMHSLAAWLPAFRGFFLPVTIGLVVSNVREGSTASLIYAFTGISFFVANWIFTTRLNGTLIASIRARHEVARLAADLKVEKDRAEEANLAKSRFLAAASHDLRQPVHALSLFVGALRQEPPGPGAAHLVERIDSTVGSMNNLFNALLDISKLDAGMMAPQLRTCELRPLLERICAEERAVAAEKGLELRTRLEDVRTVTDPVLFERVARNLIVNALRYTDRGGVLVSLRRRGRDAVVRVVDTGIGIEPARQEEVFHEFVQLHNPERDRNQGLGLGLAIVRRLAGLLDIRLALRSRPGRGSSFTLRMVALEGATAPAAAAREAMPVAQPPADAGLVLVVDDDAGIRVGMRALLAGWGYAVIDAAGIADLLPQLRTVKQVPRLVISDFRLRGEETGQTVVERLRHEYNEDIPAIIITGDTAPERLREAASGGHALLHKPVQPPQLRSAMAQVLATQADVGAAA